MALLYIVFEILLFYLKLYVIGLYFIVLTMCLVNEFIVFKMHFVKNDSGAIGPPGVGQIASGRPITPLMYI